MASADEDEVMLESRGHAQIRIDMMVVLEQSACCFERRVVSQPHCLSGFRKLPIASTKRTTMIGSRRVMCLMPGASDSIAPWLLLLLLLLWLYPNELITTITTITMTITVTITVIVTMTMTYAPPTAR